MKKALLAMIFATTIFSSTAITTQAQEKLDIAEMVYPADTEKTNFYSLKLLTYGMNYKKFTKGSNNFEHITLTNGETYKLLEYATAYVAAKKESSTQVLTRALNDLTAKKKPTTLMITPGKFVNGRVVSIDSNEQNKPEVKEFKVIDIK